MTCKPFSFKFIVYRCSSDTFITIANCENHGLVRVFKIDAPYNVKELTGAERFPDCRQFYPWDWSVLGPIVKSKIYASLPGYKAGCQCDYCSNARFRFIATGDNASVEV